MIELHPEFLEKDGVKEFAVLPYDEFLKVKEIIEDAEDVLALREAKAEDADAPSTSLSDARKKLGL